MNDWEQQCDKRVGSPVLYRDGLHIETYDIHRTDAKDKIMSVPAGISSRDCPDFFNLWLHPTMN